VVKTGDVVKVKVIEVDVERKRIALSMKLDAAIPDKNSSALSANARAQAPRANGKPRTAELATGSAMAAAFAQLKR
jgi:protein Tex